MAGLRVAQHADALGLECGFQRFPHLGGFVTEESAACQHRYLTAETAESLRDLAGDEGTADHRQVLGRLLGEQGIDSILLEGGSAVNDSAVRSNILNQYYAFIAPKIIGGERALSPVGGKGADTVAESLPLIRERIETFEDDVLIIYNVGGK